MEREAEWVSEKASADGAEENGGVVDVTKTKQNRSRQAGMVQQSVYLVGDEGSLSSDGTSGMKIREVNHSINGKNKIQVNGKTEFRTKESDNLENALVSEETSDRSSTDVILDNGSSSKLPSNGCNEIGVGRSELEIEEDTRVELVKKSKQEVAEIDLAKVLEEQETYHLFCPNCSSCITKRVILRKRKRTPRETQYETPPAKVQQLPHLDDTTASVDEMAMLGQDTEPDVFRCLSCFSFFIPTDTGFNIFRIFGRRETENQLTSQLSPAKTEITSPPIFKPVGITSGASESGLPMASDATDFVRPMGETSTNIQTYPDTTTLEAIKFRKSRVTIERNDADTGFNIFRIFRSRETENQLTSQLSPAKTEITSPPIFKPVGITSGTSDSGLPMPSDSTIVSVQHMGETSTSIQTYPATTTVSVQHMGETSTSIQTYPATTALGDFRIGRSQITTEMSGSVVGVQFGVESNNNSGKDPSFKEKQSPLTISVLGDSGARNIEEGQSTNAEKAADGVNWVSFISDGKQVADPAESSMQIYLDKTVSEAPIVGNNQVMTGCDMSGPISIVTSSESTLISENINAPVPPATVVSTHIDTHIYLGERSAGDRTRKNWDVLKSIVYGGLIESLTSLSIVSSAAGSDASTLNIVALGLANLIGGLFVIAHDLLELRTTQEDAIDKNGEPVGRYSELLGRKANFRLHATVAVLTYMLVGLLPPLIYGFSFRKSDNKEYKLIVVAAASFVCISLLAVGKAHVNARKAYFKSLAYYLSLSFAASGLSYVAGVMIHRFLDQLGLYDNTAVAPVPPSSSDIYHGIASTLEAWASS